LKKRLFNKACTFYFKGNSEDAIALLKQVVKISCGWLNSAKNDADFDNIRNDKRFIELIENSELTDKA